MNPESCRPAWRPDKGLYASYALWNPHGTYERDLLLFVDVLGFTPMETLVAATRMGGEIMGMANELGQIKLGYLADVLLVDGNPLADIKRLQDQDALLSS